LAILLRFVRGFSGFNQLQGLIQRTTTAIGGLFQFFGRAFLVGIVLHQYLQLADFVE
jgi:hypothetical protein